MIHNIQKIQLLESRISAFLEDTTEPLPPNRVLENPNFRKWFGDSVTVNSDGTPMVFYHQTSAESAKGIMDTGFDISKGEARLSDNLMPDGIFFKPTDQDIKIQGKEQLPVYLSLQNPLQVSSRSDLQRKLPSDIGYALTNDSMSDAEYKKEIDRLEKLYNIAYKEDYYSQNFENSKKILQDMEDLIDKWDNSGKVNATDIRDKITSWLKKQGHDGLIMLNDEGSFGRSTSTYIVFSPNQIKSIYNNGQFSTTSNNISEASHYSDETKYRLTPVESTTAHALYEQARDVLFYADFIQEGTSKDVKRLLSYLMDALKSASQNGYIMFATQKQIKKIVATLLGYLEGAELSEDDRDVLMDLFLGLRDFNAALEGAEVVDVVDIDKKVI